MKLTIVARCSTVRFFLVALSIAVTSLQPISAKAEYLGLLAGRDANPAKSSRLTLELGFATGKLGTVDYQNIAARVNYRLSPELVFIGSAGVSEYAASDGVPLGFGFLYHLSRQRISQKVEIAGKASYHTGDFSTRNLDGDISNFSFEVLVSGREPLAQSGLNWYSNVGLHRITIDFGERASANELGLGGGLVLPTGLGEAYIGAEYIDEWVFGLGIRYFVPDS